MEMCYAILSTKLGEFTATTQRELMQPRLNDVQGGRMTKFRV